MMDQFANSHPANSQQGNSHHPSNSHPPGKMDPRDNSRQFAVKKCDFCDTIIDTEDMYVDHNNSKHLTEVSTSWHSCPICQIYFPTKKGLADHKARKHPNTWRYKKTRINCEFCENTYSSSGDYMRHARRKHPERIEESWRRCGECEKLFPSLHILGFHMNSVHSTKPKTDSAREKTQCNYCQKLFFDPRIFYRHANSVHYDEVSKDWFQCENCFIFFPSMEILIYHQSVSLCTEKKGKIRYTQCEYCPRRFCRTYMYANHATEAHLDNIKDKWYKCTFCVAYFPEKKGIDKHLQMHQPKPDKDPKSRVQCVFCSITLCERNQYYKHANKFHAPNVAQHWFHCQYCNFYLPTEPILGMHVQNAHRDLVRVQKKYNCEYCSFSSAHAIHYNGHMNKKHQETLEGNWIKCIYCPLYYPTPKAIRHHKFGVHKNEFHHVPKRNRNPKNPQAAKKCPYCEVEFRSPVHFYKHANSLHKEEIAIDWLGCKKCPLHYPTQSSLRLHTNNVHSEIKSEAESVENDDDEEFVAKIEKKPATRERRAPERAAKVKVKEEPRESKPPVKTVSKPPQEKKDKSTTDCEFCNEEFTTATELVEHCNYSHPEHVYLEWLPCFCCSNRFPDLVALCEHLKSQGHEIGTETFREGLIKCLFCNESYEKMNQYVDHSNQCHANEIRERWHQCDTCYVYFPTPTDLDVHVVAAHRIKDEPYDEDEAYGDNYQDIIPEVNLKEYSEEEGFEEGERKIKEELPDSDEEPPSDEDNEPDYEPVEIKYDKGEHKCDPCGLNFKRKEYLRKHNFRKHKTQVNVTCEVCGNSIPEMDLKTHMRKDHPEVFEVMQETERKKAAASFACPDCDKVFDKRKNLVRHKRRVHTIEPAPAIKCKKCPTKFKSKDKLVEHMKEAHEVEDDDSVNENGGEASQDKDSDTEASTPEAAKIPMENGQYKCIECGKLFDRADYVKKHRKRVHVAQMKVSCPMCGKLFSAGGELSRHQRRVHLRVNIAKCDVCHKLFSDKFSLRTHFDSVHALIKHDCPTCGKLFSSVNYLKRHNDLVHLKSKNYNCEECGQAFSENHVLKRHFLAVHLKHRNFECEICGQTFSENHVLKRHIQSVHLKQKNHECKDCGKSFSENHVLKRHYQSVHLKEKNYNCEVCGQTFSENHVLKRHRLIHTKRQGEGGSEPPVKRQRKMKHEPPPFPLGDPSELAAGLAAGLSNHERLAAELSQQERLQSGLSGQDRHQSGLPGQDRHQSGLPGQDRHQSGLPGQDRHQSGLPGQDRHQSGLSGQDKHQSGLSGQDRHQSGLSGQDRHQSGISGQDRHQSGHSGQDRHQSGMSGHDRHQSAMSGHDRHQSAMSGHDRHQSAMSGHDRPGLTDHERLLAGLTGQHERFSGLAGHHERLAGLSQHHERLAGLSGLVGLTGLERHHPGYSGNARDHHHAAPVKVEHDFDSN